MNIQRSIYWLVFIFLSVFLTTTLSYSRVRVVEMNDNKMETITLSMGHSTILHFIDRPKKAVNGNSNYFSIKFTGNDVTIQPLSQLSSNLFIYSGQHRFGFILRVCRCQVYDDLVKVYWKRPTRFSKKLSLRSMKTHGDQSGQITTSSQIKIIAPGQITTSSQIIALDPITTFRRWYK